ncbi:MAG: serine/threonine-protein kinase, partial [Kofleriaceae bacterium]
MIGTHVGPFTVVGPLGEGGMGKVYLAEHAVLKTQRAVKFLSPQLTENAVLVRRFVNEARAAARLQHRNLIQVHDVGQLATGAWFMVLDYLDGATLGRLMASHAGPMPLQLIVHIVCEIANGLQVAHDHKIVHRDLKPENVLLIVREGDPHHAVLLDFGVAQLGDDPAAGPDTRRGVVIGTPAYMAPEQLRGTRVSPAADIFALGVIAYRMCTGGWFPYQHGESRAGYCELPATELYHRQMSGPPVDPRERVPGLSGAWTAAILAAVDPDPARRPASARAFALRIAEAVPASGAAPDGIAIVRTFARELVEADAELAVRPTPPAAQVSAVGSRYQLGELLGTGGTAEVYAGTMIGAEGFARRVAIKRVLSSLAAIPAFARMFVAEAGLASRLAHPNIVSVLDVARDPGDRLVLVMEYVDGQDLATLLASGPIAPSLAIFIAVELLRALDYAHDVPDPERGARGVIHRAVSPHNLLLSYEGAVKVSDFGLTRICAASERTGPDRRRRTPSYLAPEQRLGEPIDGRADLYAVGVMLWEMLARRPLFAGTANEILAQVMFKELPAPTAPGGGPADLEAVALTLLARDPADRYASAAAAIDALLRCADVPRDGRGELTHALAERFPTAAGARSSRRSHPPGTLAIAARTSPITVAEPASEAGPWLAAEPASARPRRATFAATVSGLVLCGLAAALVIARGEVAPSAAPRIAATGELAIIVTPPARIWLDGKPLGQTPLRTIVAAGRHSV